MPISLQSITFRAPNTSRLVKWANAFMVVVLAHSLAQITWMVWPAADVREAPRSTGAGSGAVRVSGAAADLDAVAGLHLFGTAERQAQARPTVIDAPETRLNLTLRGVVAASDPERAFAIISRGNGPEQTHKVGSQIPGGAVLREIHADRVILERGGRFETLKLPKDRIAEVESQLPTAAQPVPEVGRQLQDLRQEILSNPTEAMKLVQVQPVMAGGRLKGYRVQPRGEKELFREAGLQPGDVVTTVNGVSLDDPTRLGDVIEQLSTADQFSLTVDRGGAEQTLTLKLR